MLLKTLEVANQRQVFWKTGCLIGSPFPQPSLFFCFVLFFHNEKGASRSVRLRQEDS